MESRKKLLVITGPTATGKSALAVELALLFGGEIISADSRQVYKGLDVGSAKITNEEMRGVPHHLIDVADPGDLFTVSKFQELARTAIDEIRSRGKIPIICGGSGMYVLSVVDNTQFPDAERDEELRAKLETETTAELLNRLAHLDPGRIETTDRDNRPRLIRAIEVAMKLGSVPELKQRESEHDALIIGLTLPKEELVERIKNRIASRIPALFEEIEGLIARGISPERLRSFGLEYRIGADYVEDAISLETFKDLLATKTWQFVRKQMTWWRRDPRVEWFNPVSDQQKILERVQDFLA